MIKFSRFWEVKEDSFVRTSVISTLGDLPENPDQVPIRHLFLAVPRQLYRFPCHWLTDSLTLLKNTTKEHSERLVTLETCDQSDEKT